MMKRESINLESQLAALLAENAALKAKNIELNGNLSAATLSINNVSDAMGLNGDGPFSLQVITKFTDLLADNETLRAMVHEMTAQRDALNSMLNDLNAAIRRESSEREKNAKLLARIEELEGEKHGF
ncbi:MULTISPECIES: hypothetical protein [Lonsdalea]|uniref:Uncharacterized protein n=2 Tax=Lonsdalea TaxID=1082702 RepID=A0ACD1JGD9_9GAMM|nr:MULTISPECIES: hypothetical protein [Lonsdalea]RAT16211.1 hypothetical protein AU485_02010 [Lonsdalea quercina]RAT23871.1 hypothetical protein AU487_00545 [Lonsdalea populi]RAT25460.1 hypothetical protein AU489_07110 [Lonsdalea populi]RAT28484.1 hypothetical protein AU488_00450 [Lonsdalea populi]RAT38290.1 hypothetical protein AU492_00490 [Lonsdalea populi]